MLELTSNGRPVVLSPGTSVGLEYNSPLFDEEVVRGNYSYSFSVPAPPNGPLYGFPERLDADQVPGAQLPAELALEGLPLLVGSQRVRSASARKYNVNLTGALGGLATSLSERAIHSFDYGGVRQMPPGQLLGGAGSLVQVPGWVLHANDVVQHPEAYDYVFAPVRADNFFEPAPAPTDPPGPAQAPAVLNSWVTGAPGAFNYGLPAGGSFAYLGFTGYQRFLFSLYDVWGNGGLSTLGGSTDGGVMPSYGQLACPFPRLRYVLRSIFMESGLHIDEANFLPGELGELVIFSPANSVVNVVDAAGVLQSHFHLADSLPDLTVAALLQGLRRGLGLVVVIDEADRRVSTVLLKDIVAAPAATVPDLTHCLAGAAEVEINDPVAYNLVYETDPDDAVTKELLKHEPDPANLGASVATLADLPDSNLLALYPETRLVRELDAYYQSRGGQISGGSVVGLTWVPIGQRVGGLEVGGPNGTEYPQGFAYTAMGEVPFRRDPAHPLEPDPAVAARMAVPAVSRPGFVPTNLDPKATPRPAVLRLLFWRGMQPASDGTLYPLVTPLATNQAGTAVGSLSLRLGGPAGTYEQLLRGWLEVKRRGVVVKQPLRLCALDLARLELARKVRFDGIEYLVRKLAATVPLRKPVMAELVRV